MAIVLLPLSWSAFPCVLRRRGELVRPRGFPWRRGARKTPDPAAVARRRGHFPAVQRRETAPRKESGGAFRTRTRSGLLLSRCFPSPGGGTWFRPLKDAPSHGDAPAVSGDMSPESVARKVYADLKQLTNPLGGLTAASPASCLLLPLLPSLNC